MNKKLLSAIMAFAMVGSQAVAFADEAENTETGVVFYESFDKGNEETDKVAGSFVSLAKNLLKWTDKADHTENNGGAAQLYRVSDTNMHNIHACQDGFEVKLNKSMGIKAGTDYEVSAWVKAASQGAGKKVRLYMATDIHEMTYYNFNGTKSTVGGVYDTKAATNEWQKLSFVWTPTAANVEKLENTNEHVGIWLRVSMMSDLQVGDVLYLDDFTIKEAESFKFVDTTLTEGQLLYAWDDGFSATFNMPVDLENSDITVKDSNGKDVAVEKSLNHMTVNVVLPDVSRKHNAEYTAHFGTIKSTTGKTFVMDKDIKFKTNTEFRYSNNFDGGVGDFMQKWNATASSIAYDSTESKTEDNSGAIKLTVTNLGSWMQEVGFERRIVEKKIVAGEQYLISAWVKAGNDTAVGDTIQLCLCDGLNEISQVLSPLSAQKVKVNANWQEVTMLWTPSSAQEEAVKKGEDSTLYLRFEGLNDQANEDVYLFDDISITAIDSNKLVTFDDFAATAGGNAITTAQGLKGNDVNISCTLKNEQIGEQDYIICFAAFDLTTNKMIDVVGAQGTLAVGESKNIAPETALDLTKAENNCTIKVFIWDGLINQSPLSEVQIPLK